MLQFLELPLMQLGVFSILAMSLQLIFGGAGLLSLGHAAFFAVGAYGSGALSIALSEWLGPENAVYCFPLVILAGGIIAALAGVLVAIPCLRLQGDYLAMATLGFGELFSNLFRNIDALGGATGLRNIPRLSSPWIIWVFAVLVYIFLRRLYKTPLGFSILATRDDEIAARSCGISTTRSKLFAFVLGSGIAGIAGVFYAHMQQLIVPDEASFLKSVEIVLAVVIGGMHTLGGGIIGAFILLFVQLGLRFGNDFVAQNSMLFFPVVVILLMILNPRGLMSVFERLFRRTMRFNLKGKDSHASSAPGVEPHR